MTSKIKKYSSLFFLAVMILIIAFFGKMFLSMVNNQIQSDFPAHINMALDNNYYSFISILFKIIVENGGDAKAISALMVVTVIMTVVLAYYAIRIIMKLFNSEISVHETVFLAFTSLFICKLCIPDLSGYYYADTLVTQPLHNSTYYAMRMVGLITIAVYFIIEKEYLNKLDIKKLLLFTSLIFITNFAKPNFIVGFAPVMLVRLIVDFIRTRTKSFRNAFFFGLCVLVGCTILIPQFTNLYPEAGGGGVTVSLGNFIDYFMANKKLPLNIFMNLAFPVYVLFLSVKHKNSLDKTVKNVYGQTWAMYILSLLEFFFIKETGIRATDMNFRWGEQFFAYALFVVSACVLLKMRNSRITSEKEDTAGKYTYILHIVFGLSYFALVAVLNYFYLEI